jgi:hypothetical protein
VRGEGKQRRLKKRGKNETKHRAKEINRER